VKRLPEKKYSGGTDDFEWRRTVKTTNKKNLKDGGSLSSLILRGSLTHTTLKEDRKKFVRGSRLMRWPDERLSRKRGGSVLQKRRGFAPRIAGGSLR